MVNQREERNNSTFKDIIVSIEEGDNLNNPAEWMTPVPIETTLLPVEPLQHDMLPSVFRPSLLDTQYRMGCPLDYVAAATIVMVSSLIGTRLAIKPKAKDNWTIVPNLWGAVIGDPSAMKTPSVSEAFKPLGRLAASRWAEYAQQMRQFEHDLVRYDARKKAYADEEKKVAKDPAKENRIPFPDQPEQPIERRYMTNDVTIEKLANLLNENPTGLLQFRDELMGLLNSWEKQGREEDRAFYLEAWNGTGGKTVDRIGRGTIHTAYLCVSLFGGIQPAKLLGHLQAATGSDNDGFVQRLQVAVYPDKPRWEYVDEYPDGDAANKAFDIIKRIADTDFSAFGWDADDHNRYPYTRFDEEGQDVFKAWFTNLEENKLPHESGLLQEHFTKYRSLMPSLALIFHVIECVENPSPDRTGKCRVTAQAARMAVAWCAYLESHARRIYGMLDTQHQVGAKTLLQHIKAGHLINGFKAREVVQKGWVGLNKTDAVEAALAELVTRHWLKEITPQPSAIGRPESPSYQIHPTTFKTLR